jgi:hypothetical protein
MLRSFSPAERRPFFDALSEQLGSKSLAVQGVEYPATFAGFNQNGTDGVPSM